MLEVVPRDWNRVGAMTAILKGLLGEGFDLVLFYAVILQAAFDTQVGEKFFDEFNGLAVRLESAEFLDVQTAGEPHAHVQAGLVFRIEVHDVREAERVGKAVMDTANGRERMRQGMSGAKILHQDSTRLNSSHMSISYAVFCLKNKVTSSYSIPSSQGNHRAR